MGAPSISTTKVGKNTTCNATASEVGREPQTSASVGPVGGGRKTKKHWIAAATRTMPRAARDQPRVKARPVGNRYTSIISAVYIHTQYAELTSSTPAGIAGNVPPERTTASG